MCSEQKSACEIRSYIGLLFSLINQDLLVYVRSKFYWFNIVFKTYSDGNFLS